MMRPGTFFTQVVAVLSRRTPAFRQAPGEPGSYPDRLAALIRPRAALRKEPADNAVAIRRHEGPGLPVLRTIVAVSIVGYNDRARTVAGLTTMHKGFWTMLGSAFAGAGIPWDEAFVEDTGDGAMILLPPEMPKADLAAQLPDRLLAEMRRYNADYVDELRIRLRMALHAGDVRDEGDRSVNFTFRLLEASQVKVEQQAAGAELALTISDSFYREVVLPESAAVPEAYRRIPVKVKETATTAWLRMLGPSASPVRPDPPQAMIRIVSHAGQDELRDLMRWLSAEEELRGRLTLADAAPVPGAMGKPSDALVVALGVGAAAVLARSMAIWLQRRRSVITVEIATTEGRGRPVTVTGQWTSDAESVIKNALAEQGR
ncbi:effector-associated constant component EACC1 [Amycolatopsis nalaikhensis]|uniref:Uncharacterized protein n=1 Tax=Amycolatopsis nalaikhensis TaxID=715472 RepID=A0ABY8XYX3_9PSEU|nr:hypothetical protein [Amycolatopsis sp. 2-2]WIV60612.1 hypothetical protein QP939_19395 [Amycolatopsis sp. 2-2]